MEQRFNLVEENWIPIAGREAVSLRQIFSDSSLKTIGGNAVQKLALLKLFLAIAQRSCTPQDMEDWRELEAAGMAERCIKYLEKRKDDFWLYGDRPFLQMPKLREIVDKKKNKLAVREIGRTYLPDLPSENDTLLFQNQASRPLTDAQKALFIVSIMNYSPGGKRTVKDVEPLTKGYAGKTNSAKSAPSLGGYVGYQNAHLLGESIIDTIWLNMFTREDLAKFPQWENDELIPPWEEMPAGENDAAAAKLKESFMSTLSCLSRFVLLVDDGIIYMEGIQYPYHKQGWREPFIASNPKGQMLWLDTSRRPWRHLTALLSAVFHGSGESSYDCPQISLFLRRARGARNTIGIWAGGLKVRGNAGDQSVKQTDDYIESVVYFDSNMLGEPWFISLEHEMAELDRISRNLYGSIRGYFKSLGSKHDALVEKALENFWQLSERNFQDLVDGCDDEDALYQIRRVFSRYVYQVYDRFCPQESARQMSAWAKNRPSLGGYLARTQKEEHLVQSKE